MGTVFQELSTMYIKVKHQFITQFQSNAYQYNKCLAEQNASLEVVHTVQRLTKSINKTPKLLLLYCNFLIPWQERYIHRPVLFLKLHLLCRTLILKKKQLLDRYCTSKEGNQHSINMVVNGITNSEHFLKNTKQAG